MDNTTGTRNCYFLRISNICYSFLLGDCFMLVKIKLEFQMRTEDSATGPCYWSRFIGFIICYLQPFYFMTNIQGGWEGARVGTGELGLGSGVTLIKIVQRERERERERVFTVYTGLGPASPLTEHKLSVSRKHQHWFIFYRNIIQKFQGKNGLVQKL